MKNLKAECHFYLNSRLNSSYVIMPLSFSSLQILKNQRFFMPAKTFKILRILNHEVFVSFVFAAEEITFPYVKKCTHFFNFDLRYRKLAFDAPNTLCLSAPKTFESLANFSN